MSETPNPSPEPTPEELKKQKFNENPDKFIDADEIIIAVKRSDKGMMLFIHPQTLSELVQAMAEVQVAVIHEAIMYRNTMAKAKQEGIITANRGMFRNFIRRK